MNNQQILLLIAGITAVSVGMLAWLVMDVGSVTLARYKVHFTQQAQFQVREFFLFIDPSSLFLINVSMMVLGGLLIWLMTGMAMLVLPTVAVLGLVPRIVYAFMRKRRLRRFEEQLPDALMMLCGGLRAGVGLNAAIQQVVAEVPAPLAQEFSLILREQRLGVSLEVSLGNLCVRMPTQTTVLVVSAMRIASETGGGLAETLERTAQTIRSRLQMEGKIDALTAQGKLQAWVVGVLPLLLMLILDRMEPETMAQLWHTQLGWGTLCVIAFLECMGVYLVRKIVRIDV